jgi:hypothetical protein
MAYDRCPRWPVVTGVEEERAAMEFGSGARELALELEKQNVGVKVMLLRVRDRELRLFDELSTATRRWQPADAPGSRGARAEGQQGRGKRSGQGGDDAWEWIQQEVARRRR